MSELLNHVDQSIRARRLLLPGQRILIAVSGGVDSMVLLHLLHALASKHGWRLTVAHLNHQLRGRSSDADERLVRATARRLRLPLIVAKAPVAELARSGKVSVEMAAREARHCFLARAARRKRITTVVLAHHADDQLELFFLRLLRGSGGAGLAGMKRRAPSPNDPRIELVRPLLDVPKTALLQYAKEHGIAFREDASNALLDFQRNRIRHELLPLLRSKYQPALDQTLPRVMEIIGAEAAFAVEAAREWLAKAGGRTSSQAQTACSSDLPFDQLPIAVQRRCVQHQLASLGISPEFDLVERLRLEPDTFVSVCKIPAFRPAPKTPDSPVQDFAVRDRSGLVHLRAAADEEYNQSSLDAELTARAGEIAFGGATVDWRISSGVGPARRAGRPVPHSPPGPIGERALPPQTEVFDADRVGSPIRLRHWQPGDRFQPIGMSRPVKLQDIFTNLKIPRPLRRRLIVAIAANGEAFWVEGLRIAERFKLTKRTIRHLQWRWKRL